MCLFSKISRIIQFHLQDFVTGEFCKGSLPCLKDPSQPPPFSMSSKLLILHGEAKSYCFTVSCVPKSMFHYLL